MNADYSHVSIFFTLEGIPVQATNFKLERFITAVPSHSHGAGCYEIHYIPQGYGTLHTGGKIYEITPNTLFVTGPHVDHMQIPLPQDPMQEYCIYFRLQRPARHNVPSPVVDAFLRTSFWFGQDHFHIHALLKQLFEEFGRRGTGYMLSAQLLLSMLILSLVRSYEPARGSESRHGTAVPADKRSLVIEECFLFEYQTITLQKLSDRLSLSPRQTQRLLKSYYGKNFQQKKAEAKMSAAAVLLSDPEKSITHISDLLGFSSPEYFSTAFKKYYSKSPGEFRRQHMR